MKINIQLQVDDTIVVSDVLNVDDYKIAELTEDEKEQAIETLIRSWADRKIRIDWEVTE